MKDEVEEFLRRVAQLRQQAEGQAKAQPAAQPPSKKSGQRPPPRPATRSAPPPRPTLAPEVVDAELADDSDRVARRVAADLHGAEEIAEHVRHLGEQVDAAQGKMDAHLHQVFDHQLGQLKQTAQAALPPGDAPAGSTMSELMRLLRSPQSIRDAIILSEVLNRPEHLW